MAHHPCWKTSYRKEANFVATWETLCENKDFRTLYYRGDSRVHAGLVTYVRRNRLGHPRIGITTGKKVGCAVKRSRARRVIREGFRPLFPQVGGYDIVFVARTRTPELKSTTLTPVIRRHLTEMGVITDG
ncbi:MAG: ribonuclease P protein component [Clostridia bacterium]|nr:ribonuclease P protein component [Clostridia bacterium]